MESTIAIDIAGTPARVFALAADVEGWPRILPHYRWVRRVAGDGPRRTVEMAARRDFYPVRWTAAIVEPIPDQHKIRFKHIRGPTRGMDVEWRITPKGSGSHVVIWHHFESSLPLIGTVFARYIAGRIFIDNIAGKTLRGMKREIEGRGAGSGEQGTRSRHS